MKHEMKDEGLLSVEKMRRSLDYIERETHLRTKSFRMISDGVQGRFLQAFSLMVKPSAVLELGTFTGYATICLSRGLAPDGRIDTVEIDDELEDIFLTAFDMAGLSQVNPIHGPALEILPTLGGPYDIVYIDANKREYCRYYDLVFDKVRTGGYILADNVAWSGKILSDKEHKDPLTRAIMDFNTRISADPRVEATTFPLRDGLSILRKL